MKVYKVPLTLAQHDSDIKIKACTENPSVICNQVLYLNFAQIPSERSQDQWSSGFFFTKLAYGLWTDFSCINLLVVSDV